MNVGPLKIAEIDKPYFCIIQLRHQQPGVLHAVIIRPDKVKTTERQCSMGHFHESAVIVLGETPGDQAAGWQYPENIYVVSVLGEAIEKDGKWVCLPLAVINEKYNYGMGYAIIEDDA